MVQLEKCHAQFQSCCQQINIPNFSFVSMSPIVTAHYGIQSNSNRNKGREQRVISDGDVNKQISD